MVAHVGVGGAAEAEAIDREQQQQQQQQQQLCSFNTSFHPTLYPGQVQHSEL